MSKQNPLQKYLAKICKGHEKALREQLDFPDIKMPAGLSVEQAIQVAKITGTSAKAIMDKVTESEFERLGHVEDSPPAKAAKPIPAADEKPARSPNKAGILSEHTSLKAW